MSCCPRGILALSLRQFWFGLYLNTQYLFGFISVFIESISWKNSHSLLNTAVTAFLQHVFGDQFCDSTQAGTFAGSYTRGDCPRQ